MKTLLCVLLVALAYLVSCAPAQRPIIGVITQDSEDPYTLGPISISTYIASSYVKNLEMAGAQVVPIFYRMGYTSLKSLLGKLNGVFLPGGEMPIALDSEWTLKVKFIMDFAVVQNKNGNPYPIWATCLSYEAIMFLTSYRTDNMTVLTEVFGQKGLSNPLIIKSNDSVLLKSLNAAELQAVTTGNGVLYFHHRWAVTLKTFMGSQQLQSFWKLISTSKTTDGVEFVSTVEAYQYPFLMTQYHPEKNSFQWRIPATRTYLSVSVEQKFINQFVNIARFNMNTFPVDELANAIIYNYTPVLTASDYDFVQVYVFDESSFKQQADLE